MSGIEKKSARLHTKNEEKNRPIPKDQHKGFRQKKVEEIICTRHN